MRHIHEDTCTTYLTGLCYFSAVPMYVEIDYKFSSADCNET